ncbi:Multidrug resistance protein 1, partial [Quaeritorhiza haematococci]
ATARTLQDFIPILGTSKDAELKKKDRVERKQRRRAEKMKEIEEALKNAPPRVETKKLFRYFRGVDVIMAVMGVLAAMAAGVAMPLMTIYFGSMTQALAEYLPTPTSEDLLNSRIRDAVLKLSIIGAAVFLASFLQMYLFGLVSQNQVDALRQSFFHSVLRQELAWFDSNATGELTNRLYADSKVIEDFFAEQFASFFSTTATFCAGVIIAFVYNWKLSLVLSSVFPLL